MGGVRPRMPLMGRSGNGLDALPGKAAVPRACALGQRSGRSADNVVLRRPAARPPGRRTPGRSYDDCARGVEAPSGSRNLRERGEAPGGARRRQAAGVGAGRMPRAAARRAPWDGEGPIRPAGPAEGSGMEAKEGHGGQGRRTDRKAGARAPGTGQGRKGRGKGEKAGTIMAGPHAGESEDGMPTCASL
jgi:hypothetical protein